MVQNSKILVVEDEHSISQLINMVLRSDGYENVKSCFDGLSALNLLDEWVPDIILLDVMLPVIDGMTLCKQIKGNPKFNQVKIIMLTAKKQEEDILAGFDSGAVDYITKPFSNKVLLARIRAQLQTQGSAKCAEIKYKNFSINPDTQVAKLGSETLNLTLSEFEIMKLFVENVGRVYSRSQILNVLRGNDSFDIAERAVDVQIVNLRRKLGGFGSNILTVRGVGYKLDENT